MDPSFVPLRVYPKHRSKLSPTSTPLSIIDSSVSNYTPCGAILLFPPPPHPDFYSPSQLQESLSVVLDVYPQWSGHLHIPSYDPSRAARDHTRRFGRVHLSWGNETDPGVELDYQKYPKALETVLPGNISANGPRITENRLPMDLFIDPASLVGLRGDQPVKPCLVIKVTRFSCGSVGVALGMHHVCGDASTLSRFVKDWADIHRALAAHTVLDLPVRPFQPLLLDSHAAGDIDSEVEEATLKETALSLTQLRLDFWASEHNKPSIISSPTSPHEDIEHLDDGSRGPAIPWETWDHTKKIKDYHVYFSPGEIQRIWASASAGARVSRFDAVLGFLWKLITKARVGEGDEMVYLDNTVGLRSRLGLKDEFIGSPLINITTTLSAEELRGSLSTIARSIRNTTESVNKTTIPPLLHHLAFAIDPIREWECIYG